MGGEADKAVLFGWIPAGTIITGPSTASFTPFPHLPYSHRLVSLRVAGRTALVLVSQPAF